MQTAPIVFALVLGWVTGHEHLPPDLVDWLTARETLNHDQVAVASCTVQGTDFKLRQVLLNDGSVGIALP